MPPMLRRWLRIFCVTVLLLLFGAAVLAQFYKYQLYGPYDTVYMDHDELYFKHAAPEWNNHPVGWGKRYARNTDWSVPHLWLSPPLLVGDNFLQLRLSWWFVLASWGLPTAVLWFLTRRRKAWRGAFPVVLTKKTERNPATESPPAH